MADESRSEDQASPLDKGNMSLWVAIVGAVGAVAAAAVAGFFVWMSDANKAESSAMLTMKSSQIGGNVNLSNTTNNYAQPEPTKDPRQKVVSYGLQWSMSGFESALGSGDAEIVGLFLEGGFDWSVRPKWQNTITLAKINDPIFEKLVSQPGKMKFVCEEMTYRGSDSLGCFHKEDLMTIFGRLGKKRAVAACGAEIVNAINSCVKPVDAEIQRMLALCSAKTYQECRDKKKLGIENMLSLIQAKESKDAHQKLVASFK